MIDSPALLADLKKQLKMLETDLRARAVEPGLPWADALKLEHARAIERERTALSWSEWSKGEISQAAVAWIIACTFIRFAEDNDLLVGARDSGVPVPLPWIAGSGERGDRAIENQSAFYAAEPSLNSRDWLQKAFGVLAALPAGRGLVDPAHSPVWTAPIGAAAADGLVDFWRRTDSVGALIHDFTDVALDTRFLGDLYQDLSDHAKKTYALLQTPIFVEEFILDHTLTPAVAEFGLDGLKLIDPTCGSGHFLLGAFERLNAAWTVHAPAMEARARVQKALNSIHGVDLNPFAVAIARFRLTVAALQASGDRSFVSAPTFGYRLAVGDSLLRWQASDSFLDIGADTEAETFAYAAEDILDYADMLKPGQYDVVVGNPPYIQVKDKALNQAYRALYPTCSGKYALSVPFMELFFELAKPESERGGAGYVGKITSNSFMKREFGKKLIEQFLSGVYTPRCRVDLTAVIDTAGAYIPGHGTPTVILFGRHRRPLLPTVRAALGVRGEPGQPVDPAQGLVWRDIVDHLDQPGYNGTYTSITDLDRSTLAQHPWSLSGGGTGDLKNVIESSGANKLGQAASEIGIMAVIGEEEAFELPSWSHEESAELSVGEDLRDFSLHSSPRFWPYDSSLKVSESAHNSRWMWPFRKIVSGYLMFGKTREQRGLEWFEYGLLAKPKLRAPLTIAFAFVATHNHFVLDRSERIFGRTAPVIKLAADATEDDHFDLLGILNSSTACFWLKQVSHDKGNGGIGGGIADQAWERFFEFTATKLKEFPLPATLPRETGRAIDAASTEFQAAAPGALFTGGAPDPTGLVAARQTWLALRDRMVFLQEELDWETYRLYGLVEEDLTFSGDTQPLPPEHRAFEIILGREILEGAEHTAWFDRHSRTPITEMPSEWPGEYRALVQRRLDAIAENPSLRLLERPEYKRRWATPSWESQLAAAATTFALDRLEKSELWQDAQGRPVPRSTSQLADILRDDVELRTALEILTDTTHVELQPAIAALLAAESVPPVAAQRYKPSGLIKFREWQQVWEQQRAEDNGQTVSIPVPPKYAPLDFQKSSYWSARGKLDVPKERFISYPGAARATDDSPIYGWAGWDHAAQGLAMSVLVGDMVGSGATAEQLTPLLAGIVELEPWLHQWHSEIDAAYGTSPAAAISGMLAAQLERQGLTRNDVTAWVPSAPTRGRTRVTKAPTTGMNPMEENS
ncbi:BREX-2 system adenine-specific DNA-methyltransferase PglX [Cryobacterium sp. N19]|uniref:BREX-2 system adenine-specific DNA-methyltransferase PglX n=1 Tax=Cryobacterium sp. N19 TaxID=2048288 RepID=UPI000CE40452|nr:BREX-2 system adenine-specific DNA-methyltransferase PglX [Cryobacterium sp. N19]